MVESLRFPKAKHEHHDLVPSKQRPDNKAYGIMPLSMLQRAGESLQYVEHGEEITITTTTYLDISIKGNFYKYLPRNKYPRLTKGQLQIRENLTGKIAPTTHGTP